ncbi:response regulator transcription factor [Porcipelethomonas sp.]|uniref:response regulator transcription factor n=1 Tax=Porcipelethomonas sp. TaxID=2981675 RepID=UPI003EF35BBC
MYKVLLVEDDSAMRYIYSKMKVWTDCGFKIAAETSNGKNALEILGQESFDLIFTDIRMPFVDGIELLRKVKELGIDTSVVFASSYDEFEYARQGLILGAFDYILKPVKEEQLRDVLDRVKGHLQETVRQNMLEPAVCDVFREIGVEPDSGNFVNKAAVYFSEHYGTLFTMEDMASYFELNKDYFGKQFKQKMGVTFSYFSSVLKISYAKELLHTGNYKTYEISDMLGYSSTDYFTKIFKEITGETPSGFRAGHKR